MALLAWLKKEGFGSYAKLDEYVGELARRSTSALGALGNAVAAVPQDLAEIAQGDGQNVCADLVRDLRVMKGARVGALRAILSAGAGAHLGRVFSGGFDLLADERIPEADRAYLCRGGLKAFLAGVPPDALNVEALRGVTAAVEAVKVIGADGVRGVLGEVASTHATAISMRHAALGDALPPELELRWVELLGKQFRAAKNAPPAAKRLGTAPEWPPVAPEAFKPLLARAEQAVPGKPAAAPATATPASTAPAAPSAPPAPAAEKPGSRMMPALRPRPRATAQPEEEVYVADGIQIPPEALRSTPAAAPAAEPAAGDASAPAKLSNAPLKSLRFAEQVELIASRGTRAMERLIASFDVRCELVGTESALAELDRAAEKRGAKNVNEPILDELLAFATDPNTPSPWRRAAKVVLRHLGPDRFATLPPEPTLKSFPRTPERRA